VDRRAFIKIPYLFLSTILVASLFKEKSISEINYSSRLFSPTYITKIDGLYFIIDCWHHRVIFTDDINNEIKDWEILDDKIFGPHSIASNKKLYVIDNTGNNSLRVYRKISRKGFELVQNIEDIGMRPHKVIYDEQSQLFYIVISGKYGQISSNVNNFYAYKEKNGLLEMVYETQIEEIKNLYTRTILLVKENLIYFLTENSILITKFENLKFSILKNIYLPEELKDPNDIYILDDGAVLITLTNFLKQPKAIIAKSISNLIKGDYEDISKQFLGVPYYINQFDNYLWIPEIRNHNRIVKYVYEKGNIYLDKVVFDFQNPKNIDIERRNLYPL